MKRHVKDHGSLKEYPFGEEISKEEFFKTKCDVVIPAALELQITKSEAENIHARVILEAANGPTCYEADAILKERGVDVVPDILANSGGVIVSYYEWLQNRRYEYWSRDDVMTKLDKRMTDTYRRVATVAQERGITLRMAAYVLSINHLLDVYSRKRTLKNNMASYD